MQRELRIAFAGASGTGKSELVKRVNRKLGLTVIESGARPLAAAMGFESPYDVDKVPGKRAEFQQRLLGIKMTEENQTMGGFITDRSVLDVLAYYALHDAPNISGNSIRTAVHNFARYTHCFVCTMAGYFNPGDDPQRLKGEGYHIIFEQLMYSLIESARRVQRDKGWQPTVIRSIPEGLDLEGRVQFVHGILDEQADLPRLLD